MRLTILCGLFLLLTGLGAEVQAGWGERRDCGLFGVEECSVDVYFKPSYHDGRHHHRYQWTHSNEGPDKSLINGGMTVAQMMAKRMIKNIRTYPTYTDVEVGPTFFDLSYRDKRFMAETLGSFVKAKGGAAGLVRFVQPYGFRSAHVVGTYTEYGLSLR